MDKVQVLQLVLDEMYHQDVKWGKDRRLENGLWMLILQEEIGEVANALLEHKKSDDVIDEMVQCVAVICSWIIDYRSRIVS